jgi:hypothetical protein
MKTQAYYCLEHQHYKVGEHDTYEFWSNLENVLGELTYLISIQHSLPNEESFDNLHSALKEEERILEKRILSILTLEHDQASIIAIRNNVFSIDDEDNLLALELFDNLLEMEIKEKILTIFNKSAHFDSLAVLNKWYYFPKMEVEGAGALISLLNSDYYPQIILKLETGQMRVL